MDGEGVARGCSPGTLHFRIPQWMCFCYAARDVSGRPPLLVLSRSTSEPQPACTKRPGGPLLLFRLADHQCPIVPATCLVEGKLRFPSTDPHLSAPPCTRPAASTSLLPPSCRNKSRSGTRRSDILPARATSHHVEAEGLCRLCCCPFIETVQALGSDHMSIPRADVHVPASLKGATLQLNTGRASPGSTGHTTKSRLREWPTPAPTVWGLCQQLTITQRGRTDPPKSPTVRPLEVCRFAHFEALNREATLAP